jgi:hypothetical protein
MVLMTSGPVSFEYLVAALEAVEIIEGQIGGL